MAPRVLPRLIAIAVLLVLKRLLCRRRVRAGSLAAHPPRIDGAHRRSESAARAEGFGKSVPGVLREPTGRDTRQSRARRAGRERARRMARAECCIRCRSRWISRCASAFGGDRTRDRHVLPRGVRRARPARRGAFASGRRGAMADASAVGIRVVGDAIHVPAASIGGVRAAGVWAEAAKIRTRTCTPRRSCGCSSSRAKRWACCRRRTPTCSKVYSSSLKRMLAKS